MESKYVGIALPPISSSDFIRRMLKSHNPGTTVIICCSREDFLKDLLRTTESLHMASESEPQSDGNATPQSSLFIPTIHLIARSSGVHLTFVPTLPHLRAHLATWCTASIPLTARPSSQISKSKDSLFVIWGLAHLHRSTAEHSAQGLSRTMAAAVEAAYHQKKKLVLVEPQFIDLDHDMENPDVAEAIPMIPEDCWRKQIPLLSGSVRYGGDDRSWAGRTTEVGSIVAKWCRFVKLGRTLEDETDPTHDNILEESTKEVDAN